MDSRFQAIAELIRQHETRPAETLIREYLGWDLPVRDRAQLLIFRARVKLLNNRPKDASHDLNDARALLPAKFEDFDSPFTLELLGDCYLARFESANVGFAERNDAEAAQDAYRTIIERFPDYENLGWIYYQSGRLCLKDNENERALARFQQALLSPSHVNALTAYCYERLGFIAFYEQRKLKHSLSFLNKALITFPAGEDREWLIHVYTLQSRVYREMHRYADALTAAETAIDLAGEGAQHGSRAGLAEALLTAGELLYEVEGHQADVIRHLQKFLEVSPRPVGVDVTWSRVHEMLGDAYFETGQFRAAVPAYLAALQYNPYHPWEVSLHYRIARSFYQQQAYEKTIEAIQRMIRAAEAEDESTVDYHAYDLLGNAYFALKQYDEAIIAYQQALELSPPNTENHDKIRQYYEFARELSQPL